MALPRIDTKEITTYLKSKKLGVEIFDLFPSDSENVRHGIYVSDVMTTDRSPYQLAVTRCGSIYTATDSFTIIFVSFQDDIKKNKCLSAIQGLVDDHDLMNGYHERDYSVEESYLNRAEYKTYTFLIKRIEIQN